jgi:hypothetical protein
VGTSWLPARPGPWRMGMATWSPPPPPTRALDSCLQLPLLSIPVLVVHGDEDSLIPLDMGRAIAAKVPGAKLLVLPGEWQARVGRGVVRVSAGVGGEMGCGGRGWEDGGLVPNDLFPLPFDSRRKHTHTHPHPLPKCTRPPLQPFLVLVVSAGVGHVFWDESKLR